VPALRRHPHRRVRRAEARVAAGALGDLEEEAVAEGVGVGVAEGAASLRVAVVQQVPPGERRQFRVVQAEAGAEVLVVGRLCKGRTFRA